MDKNIFIPVASLTDWIPIEQGHFGSIYKAKYTCYKVHVAVKKLKGNVPQGLKELISEAEKMASASAIPYVIRLFGILEEDKFGPGIVMEYMEYGSLWNLMERVSNIPWALKFRIIHQVTLGMNWLHNLSPPLLHLDLKTKNVLLNGELHIKITDFGLSKYTSGSSTREPEYCEGVGGTLEYMPPEAFQKGYHPSTSTDVYSFAILSAVVLRGENPYSVDISALIRELVSRGQRPCLQALENEMSVKYLNEAIKFTKRCWDNDKSKRPPFSECCNEWNEFFNAYDTCEIRKAVRQIQDEMDSSASSCKTTTVSHTTDTASVNTKDMSEMVHKLRTLDFSEGPTVLVESVPETSSPNMQAQPTMVRRETLPQGDLRGAVGSNYRTQSQYYQESVPVMSPSYRQSQPPGVHPIALPQGHPPGAMGSNYRTQSQYYRGVPPMGHQTFPYVPQSNIFQPRLSQPTIINISGSKNFQIGDNTTMTVTDNPHPGSYQNMCYRQPVHNMRYRYPTLMSPQPKQTTQGYYNMPAREASSDQPRIQKIVAKSDEQAHIRPGRTAPEGNSNNASNKQILTPGSMSNTESSTKKNPGH
ncbi:receptor-interacting serine/threonine-protein kinase 3 [Rhinoderma darwinii]|uniref:receptor-interacting serine/threonine-protein kinase 3 n=1 Tax=Rhinoderma darwinii TaxID=43563 RepID=UPI003F669BBC